MAKKPTSLEDIPLSKLSVEHIPLVRAHVDWLAQQTSIYTGVLRSLEGASSNTSDAEVADKNPQIVRRPPRTSPEFPTQVVKPIVFHEGSWADTIHKILVHANRPLSFSEMREELLKTPLAAKMSDEVRPYYSTVQRMRKAGNVVYHNGGLTTPEVLEKFKAEVAAGRAVDIQHARYRNVYAEAIHRFLVSKAAPVTLREIMKHLKTLPEFKDKEELHQPYVIKMMNKLCGRGKSAKRLDRGIYIAIEFAPDETGETAAAENERATEGDLLSVARH